MIINLNKNQGYQLCSSYADSVTIDLFNGAVINRISIDLSSGQKSVIKQISADECITLYNGKTLKRIQQNLIIE